MFASASTGTQPNNDRFSICSTECMEAIITTRAQQPSGCFIGRGGRGRGGEGWEREARGEEGRAGRRGRKGEEEV